MEESSWSWPDQASVIHEREGVSCCRCQFVIERPSKFRRKPGGKILGGGRRA
jgi:hypothetical protein